MNQLPNELPNKLPTQKSKQISRHSPTHSSEQILRQLISFDTTSYKSNLDLIAYVRELLTKQGVESECVYDQSGEKANLYATIGPTDRPGVMLSGHTDVVPVEGQAWTTNPFALTRRDEHYIGRGTADMKGFIASALAAVPAMKAAELSTPIHLALSYDEEVGCLGVRRLISMLSTMPTQPKLAIIGEPTSMQAVTGHKGKTAFSVIVTGKSGHSAYTSDAVNAIEYAARLIAFINTLHQQRAQQGPFDQGYKVPHSTLHVGTISGGTALNIVPNRCEFVFEIRNIPTDLPDAIISEITATADKFEAQMRRTSADASIVITEKTAYPALNTAPDHPAVTFVKELLNPNESAIDSVALDPNDEVQTGKVSFGTEGGLFSQSLGVPAVVCGPGNIAQAHKPDEFLATSQLLQCDKLMHQLVQRCQHNLEF